jgi:hypothetical protein
MRAFREYRGARRSLLVGGFLTVATAPLAVAVALAAPSKSLTIVDTTQDTKSPLDILSARLSRSQDGRLRAIVSFTTTITPKTLLAPGGTPGSACLRIWTAADADPKATRPDLLVCATARSENDLRGGVYEQTGPGLPRRIANASAKVNRTGRSVVIRVSQSALGRPKLIRVAVETTRPGCEHISCMDVVPDHGSTRRFRLRT